ncbi:SH3 domain protein [Talaromyces stipitatus ATCC 10500]|uniref:SH3 domain protein n=1 Tax=Talaromyces stipitatus (strain ATCC 10500 / CBS 375.48 / QM 6759 / NRRL 1006) TaxID=441959 RepID=B8M8J9_TALSN|nr:SH3 domain protein [Talaromyces stipitatus ATCC 10500]EED20512.1 SH3 domain protein [Talaromyces stipitatus ATCC 10500]
MSDPPFTVKALFEYTSEHEDDLHFSIGQVITVTAVEDADWFFGEYVDDSGLKQEGIFPRNFVERYEPTAPPRPSRPVKAKREADPVPPPAQPAPETTSAAKEVEDEPTQEEEPEPAVEVPKVKAAPLPSPPPPAPAAKAPPLAVSTKPSSNAFRDRIAAFNKPAAPPIAPFKPGGASSNSFIKKPFVAPPPSKNAYVPIPREQPPPKVYRREEDPEIANRERPASEHSVTSPPATEPAQDEDQPKPTSLKERIALLQKQQLEQASRMAEAAQKKEKAKKPPKKRTDVQEAPPVPAAASEGTELEHAENLETPRGERPSFEGEGAGDIRPSHLASPPQPSRELMSDTNDADYSGAADTEDAEETSTSKEDVDERPRSQKHAVQEHPAADSDNEAAAEDDDEEEEEVDPEVKRRMELRARMAKMSGGMGMMGMFGGGMSMPSGARKVKPAEEVGRHPEESEGPRSPTYAPPVPIMALPGMNVQRPPPVSSPNEVEKEDENDNVPVTQLHSPEELPDVEDLVEEPRKTVDRTPPPPPPQERAVPHLPSAESRPLPPPVPGSQPGPPPPAPEPRHSAVPPRPPTSPSPGSESDDELSVHTKNLSLNSTLAQTAAPDTPPPPPRRSSTYDSVRSPTLSEKRFSRGPPPIPTNPPQPSSPPQARPPPPPPPGILSRQSTSDNRYSLIQSPIPRGDDIQDETTEYEADYDTDIPPTAKHKDAIRSHGRESSIEDAGDDLSPQSPRAPPPLPPTAPRAVPPPPPPNQPPNKRASMDVPRSAPPPPPPVKDLATEEEEEEDDDEYDPYRYDSGRPSVPPLPSNPPPPPRREEYDGHDDSPVSLPQGPPPPPPERAVAPPPPPPEKSGPPPPPATEPPRSRQSLDISRAMPNMRRSMDIQRPSVDMGYIATDVDLAESTFWWTQPNIPPPVFQNRKDVLFEIEESTSTKRGGKTMVNKDVYVLFADYSQTIINVRFDAKNPSDVSFEQRHEAPPNKLRQDQLEAAHERFGSKISTAANSVQNTTVGDGTSYGLIQHLLSPLNDVLLPVGTRSYGALVYANLANASVQQHDEIRAGDIISFRNARFQGHKGGLHQKYSAEVGKPDHVGVIVDWDGTKKKIHAWEQGRESKKVKPESFKLGDLKSGEVKVWRVMPRSWVGWDDK